MTSLDQKNAPSTSASSEEKLPIVVLGLGLGDLLTNVLEEMRAFSAVLRSATYGEAPEADTLSALTHMLASRATFVTELAEARKPKSSIDRALDAFEWPEGLTPRQVSTIVKNVSLLALMTPDLPESYWRCELARRVALIAGDLPIPFVPAPMPAASRRATKRRRTPSGVTRVRKASA